MKKTFALVAAVLLIHGVVITSLILAQGCKSTKGTSASTAPAPVMPPMEAPSAEPAKPIETVPAGAETKTEGTTEYIVKSGDSLGSIAKKHNVSKSEIIDLNKIKDPNKIRLGQKLIIPARGHGAEAASAKTHEAKAKSKKKGESAPGKTEAAAEPSLAKGINEYVVQAGDSLSKICAKLNVKMGELREVNKLANDKLKIGQKLIIPGTKKAEGTEAAPAPAPAAPESAAAPAKTETPAPAKDVTPAAAPAASGAPAKNAGAGITHVVLPNEDLNTIAKLYVVSADDIAVANQMGTNRTVQAGQKIIIPQP